MVEMEIVLTCCGGILIRFTSAKRPNFLSRARHCLDGVICAVIGALGDVEPSSSPMLGVFTNLLLVISTGGGGK